MSINLLETVQVNLGYPPLQKIDPNTREVVIDGAKPDEDKFSQAAIPAILAGFYRYVQTDEGATGFLRNDNRDTWMEKLFNDNRKEAIESIAAYALQSNQDPIAKMNAIANETEKIVKENLSGEPSIKEVKIFFNHQKNHILLYLPSALNIGALLHDNGLDDHTNKMEGPISSLMRNIGAAFTNTDDVNAPR